MKHALAGAFLSAVLFEIAKAAFVAYAANTNYTVIYGAIALVPIFLFWLYLVWTVILFGASLAASLTTFTEYSRYETHWPERFELQLAYRLLGHFWDAQRRGDPLTRDELLELESQASELQLMKLIAGLRESHVLSPSGDDGWVLAGDTLTLSVIGEVRFERNESGEVTGMRVSNGRVRNVRFQRVEW